MLVPKLRFKREDGTDYPEWEEKTMSEIFTEIIEKNRSELPVLSILQGQGTVYRDSSCRNITYDKKSTVNYKAMRKGDFIIHLRTFEGGLECATLDGISSPAYKILRTSRLVPGAYKSYFRSKQFICRKLAIAVTGVRDGKNIDMNTFWQIVVPVPALEEQQKIADFLSTVDEVIAQSKAEVQNLEQQKKAAMQKIFSQEVRFKREDGSDYPEWEETDLNSIGSFYGGLSGKTKENFGKGNSKFVTYMNVYKNVFASQEMLEFVDVSDNEKQNKVQYGDLLMTQSSETVEEVGMSSVYLFRDEPYLNSFCFGLHLHNLDYTNPMYVGYLMRSKSIRKQIMSEGQGISRINLSPNRIRGIILPIPCLEEQQKIADFLSAYDEAIRYAKQELDKWKELKKGLLQQMFV